MQRVSEAALSKKINTSTDKELTKTLSYIYFLLGLKERDLPDTEIEEPIIKEFIKEEYGEGSCEELKLAFKLGLSGKTKVDPEIYGKRFSSAYISRFMNAYVLYKEELIKKEKAHLREMEIKNRKQLPPPPPPSKEDIEKMEQIMKEIREKTISPTRTINVKGATQVLSEKMYHQSLVENFDFIQPQDLKSLIKECKEKNDLKTLAIIDNELKIRATTKNTAA